MRPQTHQSRKGLSNLGPTYFIDEEAEKMPRASQTMGEGWARALALDSGPALSMPLTDLGEQLGVTGDLDSCGSDASPSCFVCWFAF